MKKVIVYIFAVLITWHAGAFWLGYSAWTPDVWGTLWFLVGFWLHGAMSRAGTDAGHPFSVLLPWAINAAHREGLTWWVTALLDLSRSKARQDAPGIEYKATGSQVVVGDTVATMTPERDKEETGLGWDVETKTKPKKKGGHSDKEVREYAENIGVKKF